MIRKIFVLTAAAAMLVACKKEGCTDETAINYSSEAKKDDGSCKYETSGGESYNIPTTYVFKDANGNSTVSYGGQIDRLNQLEEMVAVMKSGTEGVVAEQNLLDMYANTGDNGGGNFSFSSGKQLENKTFTNDVQMFKDWMADLANASTDFAETAASGQAGVLTSGSSKYLFDANGYEPVQLIEKGLMGAVFMHQAVNGYFGETKMNVDNSNAVDPTNGKYYTEMEHHFDEAFGYFGVPTDFPTNVPGSFWGKYCDKRDAELNSNSVMMDNFLKGRAAISNNDLTSRDAAITEIRQMWELITAKQAVYYLNSAKAQLGSDNAKAFHALSEAYAFAWNIRYAPLETRKMSQAEHGTLMNMFPENMWNISIADINSIVAEIEAKY
ncbi:DUF4856 domain-containing protein [Brumimicrobium salinarum]|uniref:DUF4856 domain-containing protein n=1 Tax=Brumimicrobium salinarum TaxID=2058658 RepID=A0A2I0R4L0_9FLAO|nr:DUF4856 domain-containing protein [Brumimicrobium salinarum]PKR81479.1 DUF4856 domain-containing protein [Brumimicrobium salinarum]